MVAFQAITPGESDYSAVLADIASKKPEALFFGGYTAEAVVIVNQMKQAGLEGVIFFGDDGTFGQDFLDRTGANGEGAYSTSLIPPASDAKAKFDAAYLAAYGQPAGKLSPYSWTAYDSAAVLIKNIESVAVSVVVASCTSRAPPWLLPCAAPRITRVCPARSPATQPVNARPPARSSILTREASGLRLPSKLVRGLLALLYP